MDSEDFYVNAPWGRIACVTWGQPTNQPVLMVHGYMDSAATFIYIVKHLPDTNYYVAIDMPGHGKSDAFPMGPLVNHSTSVEAMRRVVDHMKWEKFILVTHSVGFITGVTWGQPTNQPVLMVHGYMDSAATFIYIVKHLPDTNYYVAIDMPGHGKSDAFPMGPLVNHSTSVEAMRRVVDHMKWEKFILVTHSVGFITGIFYNNLYPFRISKMVNLDPVPPLSTYNFHQWNPMLWYHYIYDDYYDNFPRWNLERKKKFKYDQAINLLVKSRKFTKEQSAVVLSRILVPTGDGMYRLSWEPSAKKLVGLPITEEMLITIVTENPPPMLNIVASEDETLPFFKKKGIRLFNLFKSIPNFRVINVKGPHDVHITNPESFVDEIIDFFNMDFGVKAKL